MGCDIHLFVEKKAGDHWISVDQWTPGEDGGRGEAYVHYRNAYYSNRNYELFAILADVRNGTGFAGIDTGDGFVPIAMPKGLPFDLSPEVKREADSWEGDGHSHSWHTLEDLLEFDWTQVTKLRGIVSAAEYFQWCQWRRDNGESPESYCGDVGGKVIKMSPEAMDIRIIQLQAQHPDKRGWELKPIIEKELENHYCRIEWEQPYYKCCRKFLSDVIPRLLRLGKPDDVRIVLWFDN